MLIIIHLKTSPGFPTHDVFQLIAKSVQQNISLFHNTNYFFAPLFHYSWIQISLQCKSHLSLMFHVRICRLLTSGFTLIAQTVLEDNRVSNAYKCAIIRRYVECVPKRWCQSRLNLQIRRYDFKPNRCLLIFCRCKWQRGPPDQLKQNREGIRSLQQGVHCLSSFMSLCMISAKALRSRKSWDAQ